MREQTALGRTQTRRAFIGQGAFAFLAAAGMGHRAFGATEPARLRFGALSDIHITRGKGSCDIFALHMAEGWKRAFDEDYAPMYVKTVKGYKFVGVHFDLEGGYHQEGAIAAFLESHRDELAGSKPFFYTQHFHPKGTCSAPWRRSRWSSPSRT